MKADAPGAVLKRERVRDFILDLVESHHPGDAIPSERALCAQLGVSRPTLRAAVDELVAAGLLVREHGRGMFVAPEKITQELVAGERTMTVPQASGAWSSRLLEFTTIQAGARVGRKLRLSPAAKIVYVARLRLVDGAPMAIEHLHIRADLVPALSARELEAGDIRNTPPAWMQGFKQGAGADEDYVARVEALREILTSEGRTPAQGALAWLWARSPRTVPIPGFRSVTQAEQNAGAIAKGPLTAGQLVEIDRVLGR